MPALKDVVDLLHAWYPPGTADGWDAVGLVYGDLATPVRKVMFAVDPSPEVAREAAEWGADLLVVHHPLFLKPVHGFAATTPKGRTLATLAAAGCALLTAHTNADRAEGGVSEALATALGLRDLAPILPSPDEALDHARLYEQTRQRLRHVESIREVVEQILVPFTLEERLNLIARKAAETARRRAGRVA